MITKKFSLFVWTLVLALSAWAVASAQQEKELTEKEKQERHAKAVAKAWAFEPDPDLPNVLVMGDSNTTGYFLKLRELLKGKANVFYPLRPNGMPDNCANTAYGLENIDRFLGDTKWAVIHFNWGLHDCWRYRDSGDGKKVQDAVNGNWRHTPEVYEANLEKIVDRLEKTGAKLIWASSSVANKDTLGWRVGDEVIFNETAAKIMEKHKIPTDDVYALTKDFKPEEFKAPGDIHFSKTGFDRIAQQVAERVLKVLEK